MNLGKKRKGFLRTSIRQIDEEALKITHTINTKVLDRYYTSVLPKGAEVQNFLNNAVVLWSHNMDEATPKIPIGRCVNLVINDDEIVATTEFNKNDSLAVRVFNAYKDGFLHAWSIGFMPLQHKQITLENREQINQEYGLNISEEKINEAGIFGAYVITKWELLEYSAVPVPGNPEALSADKVDSFKRELVTRGLLEEKEAKELEINKKDAEEKKEVSDVSEEKKEEVKEETKEEKKEETVSVEEEKVLVEEKEVSKEEVKEEVEAKVEEKVEEVKEEAEVVEEAKTEEVKEEKVEVKQEDNSEKSEETKTSEENKAEEPKTEVKEETKTDSTTEDSSEKAELVEETEEKAKEETETKEEEKEEEKEVNFATIIQGLIQKNKELSDRLEATERKLEELNSKNSEIQKSLDVDNIDKVREATQKRKSASSDAWFSNFLKQ